MQDELKNSAQEARKDTAQGNAPQVEESARRTQESGQETNLTAEQAAAKLLKSPKRRGINKQLREQLQAEKDRAEQLQAELQELRTRESMQADERTASLLERIKSDRTKIAQLRELCGQYKHRAQYMTAEYIRAYKLAVSFVQFENACKAYMRRILPDQTPEFQYKAYCENFGGKLVELEKHIQSRLGAQIMDAAACFID